MSEVKVVKRKTTVNERQQILDEIATVSDLFGICIVTQPTAMDKEYQPVESVWTESDIMRIKGKIFELLAKL